MSVHNGAKHLTGAVESILSQTFGEFEFLVIDDGSTDNSCEILSSYRDTRLKIIRQSNIGLTKSLNKLLDLAQGEYIARQDADDIAMPERLAKQVRFLDEHPDYALVGTQVVIINDSGSPIGNSNIPTRHRDLVGRLAFYSSFVHSSVMFRKSCVVEIGGYDELFPYAQDYELWVRLIRH